MIHKIYLSLKTQKSGDTMLLRRGWTNQKCNLSLISASDSKLIETIIKDSNHL
jgi:hypothetical protein